MVKITTVQLKHTCGAEFEESVIDKLWVERKSDLAIIESGQLNVIQCPNCEWTFQAPMPVLCTNVQAGYAVWYLPVRSEEWLDYVKRLNRSLARIDTFYANPPQTESLKELLQVISEFEEGTRDCTPLNRGDTETRVADTEPNNPEKLTVEGELKTRRRYDSKTNRSVWERAKENAESEGEMVPYRELSDKQKIIVNMGTRADKAIVFVRNLGGGPALYADGVIAFDFDLTNKSVMTKTLEGHNLLTPLSAEQSIDAHFLHGAFYCLADKYGKVWVGGMARMMDKMMPGLRKQNTADYKRENDDRGLPPLSSAELFKEGTSRTMESFINHLGVMGKSNDIQVFRRMIAEQGRRTVMRTMYEMLRGALSAIPGVPEQRVKNIKPLRDAIGGLESMSDTQVIASVAIIEELMSAWVGAEQK
jgi:hypothetical protein